MRRIFLFTNSIEAYMHVAKDAIPFERLHKYLPFALTVKSGDNFNHIVNESIFPIELETRGHTIHEGDTLCKRAYSYSLRPKSSSKEPCPGCIAIARGLAVKEALRDEARV